MGIRCVRFCIAATLAVCSLLDVVAFTECRVGGCNHHRSVGVAESYFLIGSGGNPRHHRSADLVRFAAKVFLACLFFCHGDVPGSHVPVTRSSRDFVLVSVSSVRPSCIFWKL